MFFQFFQKCFQFVCAHHVLLCTETVTVCANCEKVVK